MGVPLRPSGPSGTPVSAIAVAPRTAKPDLLRAAVDAGITLFEVDDVAPFIDGMHRAGVARDEYRLAVTVDAPDLVRAVDGVLDGAERLDFLVLGPALHDVDVAEPLAAVLASGLVLQWAVALWPAEDIHTAAGAARARGLPGPDFARIRYGPSRRTVAESDYLRSLGSAIGLTLQGCDTHDDGLLLGGQAASIIEDEDVDDTVAASAELLDEVAAGLGGTAAQLALAIPLCHPQVSSVLVHAATREHVDEAVGTFAFLERVGVEGVRHAAHGFWFGR